MSYLDEQNVHVFTHSPYSADLKGFFFLFAGDEAETGRTEVFNGYMVCQHLSELKTLPLIMVPEGM